MDEGQVAEADDCHLRFPRSVRGRSHWSEIAESRMALARAIANNYNDVKHPKRGPMPPAEHTYVAGKVALLVVRLLALRLMEPSMTLISSARTGSSVSSRSRSLT